MLIGGLVAEPSRTTCRVDDDHTVELSLGTPNARSVDTSPVTERLVRAAELDARRVDLNAELDALPAHPWTTREEETWQPAAARADITASRRIVIDTLSQPGRRRAHAPHLQNGADPPDIQPPRIVTEKRPPMGNTFTFTRPQPPKDPAPNGKRPSGKRILLAVVSTAVAVTGIGIGVAAANNSTTTTVAAPDATTTPAAPAPASSAPSTGSSIDPSSLATPGTGQAAATPNPTTTAADTTWTVTKIVDGDTVDVTKAGTTNRIRVIGIDTPEVGQCGYLEATANMKALLAGKHVNVVAGARDDVDRYGRYLRYLDVDGTDAGLRQIQAGLAVARYDSRDGYGAHPRETSYVAADAASPKAPCTGAATPQPVPNKPANPAPRRCRLLPPGRSPATSTPARRQDRSRETSPR